IILATKFKTTNWNLVFSQSDVLGLCEVGELEVQMFNLAQMLIRIPILKYSTSAPILPNPSYVRILLILLLFNNKYFERTEAE
ncbi:MAG: hypothetical protein QM535_20455, partial [Limnohabitans sp.]|nr:hypothetical protein [Limnohabitans sp.]